jgi:hypothetical protein
MLSRPHRPPWLSCQRLIGVAGPCGRVCAGHWRLAFCSAELARQQTHYRSHAVQAVALFPRWSVVCGAVHVIGDFLALPILDNSIPARSRPFWRVKAIYWAMMGSSKPWRSAKRLCRSVLPFEGASVAGAVGLASLATLCRQSWKPRLVSDRMAYRNWPSTISTRVMEGSGDSIYSCNQCDMVHGRLESAEST